ncbi:MAG: hypothetical protein CMM07_00070 [Rhodopirellula sp.]|nr:hypothetical protein [Rhodopirellula sp.]
MTISENSRYESGLEGCVSAIEARAFLRLLGVPALPPSKPYLVRLIRAIYCRIPFQNLTMLTRPRAAPAWNEIIEDMLSGLGGLCTTINPFVCAFLHQLGFRSVLLTSTMLGRPDSHIAIGVWIEERLFWIDLANGFPYLMPLATDRATAQEFAGFRYRLEPGEEWAKIYQDVLGKEKTICNQEVCLTPVHYSHFDQMRLLHYSDPSFGPFLRHIRLNRWELENGYILRDNMVARFPGCWEKLGYDAVSRWIRTYFKDERLVKLYFQSIEALPA